MKIRKDGILEPQPVHDRFRDGEVPADQSGAGGVLTFTFAKEMDLIWVRSDGADSRCNPFGGNPSATAGIICEDGIPHPITLSTTTIKVFAPAGAKLNVWGYRYT
jgi:hypothetical protein